MANLELQNKINVPFADKGDKINVPDTSSEGTVNMTDGFGSKYDTPIAEGGEYIYREEMNDILNKVYAAVKELQDLAIAAGFPVDMTKALNVLPIVNGGTGANSASQARSNLELGSIATLNTIDTANIANNAVTNAKISAGAVTSAKIASKTITAGNIADNTITSTQIAANAITASELANNAVDNAAIANGAVTDSKLSGVVSISHGGTGRTNGMSNGIADNTIITENNWQTAEQRGLGVLYWQTTDIASKKLPYTAGAMIRNYFVSNLKSALAFDLGNAYVSIFDFKQNRWKQIAFNDDVVNKMPKVSKNNGIGYLQQIAGQGVQVTYRLPSDGTYFYFLTCTNDYNNYNAVDNKAGIAEGGSEIISASMNKKTFGGFIWRIQ